MTFGQQLRNYRIHYGYTMERLAEKVGVSKATVQRWESGEIKNVRPDKISAIAEAFNLPSDTILSWFGVPSLDEYTGNPTSGIKEEAYKRNAKLDKAHALIEAHNDDHDFIFDAMNVDTFAYMTCLNRFSFTTFKIGDMLGVRLFASDEEVKLESDRIYVVKFGEVLELQACVKSFGRFKFFVERLSKDDKSIVETERATKPEDVIGYVESVIVTDFIKH